MTDNQQRPDGPDEAGVIRAPAGAAPAAESADDLAVMHPERRIHIAGREVVMREYGFVESLRLAALLDPIIDSLRQYIATGAVLPDIEEYPAVLAQHADALLQLVATAADVEPEWLHGLTPDEGHELVWWWWVVNGPFCVRAAGRRRVLAQAAVQAREAARKRAGPTSTPS